MNRHVKTIGWNYFDHFHGSFQAGQWEPAGSYYGIGIVGII